MQVKLVKKAWKLFKCNKHEIHRKASRNAYHKDCHEKDSTSVNCYIVLLLENNAS
jgi:hypothetical protein